MVFINNNITSKNNNNDCSFPNAQSKMKISILLTTHMKLSWYQSLMWTVIKVLNVYGNIPLKKCSVWLVIFGWAFCYSDLDKGGWIAIMNKKT